MNGETTPAVSANVSFPIQSFRNQCTRAAHIVFGPLVEQMFGLSLSDPAVLGRFRDAAVDLLTHPVFGEVPADGDTADGTPDPQVT